MNDVIIKAKIPESLMEFMNSKCGGSVIETNNFIVMALELQKFIISEEELGSRFLMEKSDGSFIEVRRRTK